MRYFRIQVTTPVETEGYMEVLESGILQRLTDLKGNTIESLGTEYYVTDNECPRPAWGLVAEQPVQPQQTEATGG